MTADPWTVHSGTYGVWMKGWNANQDGGFYQDVAATPGRLHIFTGYTRIEGNFAANSGEVHLEVIFLDGVGTELMRHTRSVSTASDWVNRMVAGVAPPNAVTCRAQLHWQTGAVFGGGQESAEFDDASLTISADSNLLANPGFEFESLEGWTEFGVAAQRAQLAGWAANSGSYGMWMQGGNANQDGGAYQQVYASPNTRYTFQVYLREESNFTLATNNGVVDLELIFYDALDAEIARETTSINTPTFWQSRTVTAVAPANAATIRAQIHWSNDTPFAGSQESALLDDAVLTTSTNLLQNSGYETGDFGNWTPFGTAAQVVQAAVWAAHTGSYGHWMQGYNSNQNGGVYQDLPAIISGEKLTYTLSGYIRSEIRFPVNGGVVNLALVFLDGGGSELSREQSTVNTSLGWTQFTMIARPPVGTATIRANIHWQTGTALGGGQESAFTDDLVLTAVPSVATVFYFR